MTRVARPRRGDAPITPMLFGFINGVRTKEASTTVWQEGPGANARLVYPSATDPFKAPEGPRGLATAALAEARTSWTISPQARGRFSKPV
jgi:hypothetical protein